jgi:ABC-type glutathione transport system ATPase component
LTPLLSLRLSVSYGKHPVLRELSLDVQKGEILGIVGRSGCGKSTLALAITRLLGRQASVSGQILYNGRDLTSCSEREMRSLRGKEIALVLQAAASALNPYLRIGAQMKEAWLAHARGKWPDRVPDVLKLLRELDLEPAEPLLDRYPSQISIGQAQRVLIATALLHQPKLLILDEPTSALDYLARAEVQSTVKRINSHMGVTVLYISHDLTAVAGICGRVAVLESGSIVETAPPVQLFSTPSHSATMALAAALRAEQAPIPRPAASLSA